MVISPVFSTYSLQHNQNGETAYIPIMNNTIIDSKETYIIGKFRAIKDCSDHNLMAGQLRYIGYQK
jgi:hypothetical protein